MSSPAPASRVLVADDERLAREVLSRYIRARPDLQLAAEATSGVEAFEILRGPKESIDLLLLDVQMPGLDGLELLAKLGNAGLRVPSVIFTTAYDRYAVRAFEFGAIDYLLKPITKDRFSVAIERWQTMRRPFDPQSVEQLRRDALQVPPQRILVKRRGRLIPIAVEDLLWVESAGDYVRLHCVPAASDQTAAGATHLVEKSLTRLAELLAPAGFVRIHRSALVSLAHVQEFRAIGSGRYAVTLTGNVELVASRTFAASLKETL